MEQIDAATVFTTDTTLSENDSLEISVTIFFNAVSGLFEVRATDVTTKNDAMRAVRASIGVRSISAQRAIDKLPEIIEEIIVINKLLGAKT
jgi:hypothetical protein